MLIYYIFELVYLFNAIGTSILIYITRTKRHTEGISFYSQLMFTIASIVQIYYFINSPMSKYALFWAVTLIHVILNIYFLFLMRQNKRISLNPEKNTFDYRILLILAALLAYVSMYEKDYSFQLYLMAIRFCNFTEALGLLPQIKLMRVEKFVPVYIGYYLLSLLISRAFRIWFWISLKKWNKKYGSDTETYFIVILADVVYVCLIADFIYTWFKHKGNRLIPVS